MGDLNKVLACLKELGFKPNVDDFQDKLVIQKMVCLFKLLGNDFGYSFSLYVRGPYSPSLTRDLYAHKDAVHNLSSDHVLTEDELRQLRALFEASDSLNPKLLEIMSTYVFLVKVRGEDERQAIVDLKKLKSFYSESGIAAGVSRAKQLFFKPSEQELKEMKSEFEEWQAASLADKRE